MIAPYRVVWRRGDKRPIEQRINIPTFERAVEVRAKLLSTHRGMADELVILDGAGIAMPAERPPRKRPK